MGGRGGSSHGGFDARFTTLYNFFKGAYGVKHAKNILDILSKAPQFIQDLYVRYASKFDADKLIPGIDKPTDAYFDRVSMVVRLNIEEVAKGDSIHLPYEVVFHEYGHLIDWATGRFNNIGEKMYGSYFEGLGRLAQKELDATLAKIQQAYASQGIDTREKAAAMLVNKIKRENRKNGVLDRFAVSDLSDMMEGAGLGIDAPFYAGHGGKNYWTARSDRVGAEIFAEMTSATIANPDSLKVIKTYFPNTYKRYTEIIGKKTGAINKTK